MGKESSAIMSTKVYSGTLSDPCDGSIFILTILNHDALQQKKKTMHNSYDFIIKTHNIMWLGPTTQDSL